MTDEIIQEVWKAKDALAARCQESEPAPGTAREAQLPQGTEPRGQEALQITGLLNGPSVCGRGWGKRHTGG